MRERAREGALAAAVVAVLAATTAADLRPAPQPGPPPDEERTQFVEGASYCPGHPDLEGAKSRLTVSAGLEPTSIALDASGSPVASLTEDSVVVRRQPPGPSDVVAYGTPAYAGVSVALGAKKAHGVAAAGCKRSAAGHWYFPAGTSAIGYDERFLVYNPFPDEAVVRVTLLTPLGEQTKAGLADIAVPAGRLEEIKLNRFVAPKTHVGAEVAAIRGRIVVWKVISATPREGPEGLGLTLGSPEARRRWFFPGGVLDKGVRERISLLNPSDRQLTATVSLAGRAQAAQPEALIDIEVPPRSSKRVLISSGVRGRLGRRAAHVSATVTSTNGVPFVAERTISHSGEHEGVTVEVGAPASARKWLLLPPVGGPAMDSIALLNPSARDGRVDVSLRSADGRLNPRALKGIRVGAGLGVEVSLVRWTRGAPTVAVVSSDVPVAADRSAYSKADSDWGDLMGFALD